MIEDLAKAIWAGTSQKRLHDERIKNIRRENSDLWNEGYALEQQIREKRKALTEHKARKQRRQRYKTDCEKFDFLATHDLQAARKLLGRIHAQHGEFVRTDHSFERRVKRFLDEETRQFKKRLDGVVI